MVYAVHHYTVPSVKTAEKSDGDHVNNRGVCRPITFCSVSLSTVVLDSKDRQGNVWLP